MIHVLGAVIAIFAASHQTLAAAGAKGTQFDILAEEFEEADRPSIHDVTGWRSGRMFGARAPNQPAATLLVGAPNPDSPNSPIHLIPFLAPVSVPDYYDHITPQIRRDVTTAVKKDWDTWQEPSPTAHGLSFKSSGGHFFEERKFGEGVIEKWVDPTGRVVAYSSYSKDVTPPASGDKFRVALSPIFQTSITKDQRR